MRGAQRSRFLRGVLLLAVGAILGTFAGAQVAGYAAARQPAARIVDSFDFKYCEDTGALAALAAVLAPPATPLSVEEVRRRMPAWLRLAELEPVDVRSARVEPFELPRLTRRRGGGDATRGEPSGPIPCRRVVLETSVGVVSAALLEPSGAEGVPWVLVIQHGYEGLRLTWKLLGETAWRAHKAGLFVVLPIMPATDPCADFRAANALYLMDRNLMGVRVTLERAVLDWIDKARPGSQVVFVGHSLGSGIGYFTSVVDDRVRAVALDYFIVPDGLVPKPMNGSGLAGLYHLANPDHTVRLDVLRAGATHVQGYGYPDRAALETWLFALAGVSRSGGEPSEPPGR